MTTSRNPVRRGWLAGGCSVAATALMFALAGPSPVLADAPDGKFPTAEQVGGDVFPDGLKTGDKFPTDWDIYDANAEKASVGELIDGKRTILAFFISAAPVSVEELKKLEEAHDSGSQKDVQMLFMNADTVGTGLSGTDPIAETARTLRMIKREEGISTPMYVAPNNVFSEKGLSNRLGFRGLPTVFIIDAEGVVEEVFVGPQDWSDVNV